MQVWDLLHSGRSSGATADPKFDSVYQSLSAAQLASSWGKAEGDDWEGLPRWGPVATLFSIDLVAPRVRSKYDPLQVCPHSAQCCCAVQLQHLISICFNLWSSMTLAAGLRLGACTRITGVPGGVSAVLSQHLM